MASGSHGQINRSLPDKPALVETEKGYIYAEYLQKVWHQPQRPLSEIPLTAASERGMWVEITTPLTNLVLTRAQSSYQYWVRETIRPRVYYSPGVLGDGCPD